MNSTARRHCLRKDPARRFQIAADLKIALEDLKAELDSGAIAPAAAVRRKTSPPALASTQQKSWTITHVHFWASNARTMVNQ